MSEATDFVTVMHDDLGEHYQRLMMKLGSETRPEELKIAAGSLSVENDPDEDKGFTFERF